MKWLSLNSKMRCQAAEMFGFRLIRRVVSAIILLAIVVPLFTLGKTWYDAHNSAIEKADVIVLQEMDIGESKKGKERMHIGSDGKRNKVFGFQSIYGLTDPEIFTDAHACQYHYQWPGNELQDFMDFDKFPFPQNQYY